MSQSPFTSLSQFSNIEIIGKGTFGIVYKGQYENCLFALKRITTSKALSSNLHEAEILNQLKSPFVLKMYGQFFDQETQTLVIVTEFAEKGDLYDFLKRIQFNRAEKTHLDLILQIFIDIVVGIYYLQKQSIIHRDLKPQNILIFNDKQLGYRAKLSDFNLSKKLNSIIDKTSTQTGTPYFIAPEILRGSLYDYRVDVWSLGIMLYYIFSGKLPYQGNNKDELLACIIKGPPTELPPDVPQLFKSLISKMLKVNPEERIQLIKIIQFLPFQEIVTQRVPLEFGQYLGIW
eukprot:EST45653.1 Kinase [Spironucleus salmonicida]